MDEQGVSRQIVKEGTFSSEHHVFWLYVVFAFFPLLRINSSKAVLSLDPETIITQLIVIPTTHTLGQ